MEQIKKRNYVFVLDFEIGRVYRYDVMTRDSEKIEEYLTELGHNIGNIESVSYTHLTLPTN